MKGSISFLFSATYCASVWAVNVDDFGAVGDGVTWDHAAIQAAMNAAGEGGVVEFTPGKIYVQCKQLLPLKDQIIKGNGATLKRCDAVTTVLTEDVHAGETFLTVADPGVFELGQSITPVKNGGGIADGEYIINHWLRSRDGNRLEIAHGLNQDYPAGSLVYVKFAQLYVSNTSTGVTIDNLTLDGNRQNNKVFLAWTDNQAIRGYSGMRVLNSRFYNLPGNGITAYGTDVLIRGNHFRGLDGPIVHLSGNTPINDSTVTISWNLIEDTNAEYVRMEHSEGVITISALNDRIRVIGNWVFDAPVPFISRFHADMQDWIVEQNTVYRTLGIFYMKVWPGGPLKNVVFRGNRFYDVGESRAHIMPGGERIQGFIFDGNQLINGHLRLHGLHESSVTRNVFLSCEKPPITVEDDSDVELTGNVEMDCAEPDSDPADVDASSVSGGRRAGGAGAPGLEIPLLLLLALAARRRAWRDNAL